MVGAPDWGASGGAAGGWAGGWAGGVDCDGWGCHASAPDGLSCTGRLGHALRSGSPCGLATISSGGQTGSRSVCSTSPTSLGDGTAVSGRDR
jgi:hypothetical protein